jgi:hypothetical protein
MNQPFFLSQITRLRTRFGDKNFDNEFVKLVAAEVHDMSESGFKRFCDVLIGSRTAHKPPLLSEFREARIKENEVRFRNDVAGATRALNDPRIAKPISEVLHREFGKVESVSEAFAIAKLRLRTSESNNDDGGESA